MRYAAYALHEIAAIVNVSRKACFLLINLMNLKSIQYCKKLEFAFLSKSPRPVYGIL